MRATRAWRPPVVPDGRGLDLTVAIATIDRPHSLARCVDAILTGTHLPAELVIVDQSLDDRTAAVVATADWDRRVRLRYLRRERRGLAASRNVAIAEASTPTLV